MFLALCASPILAARAQDDGCAGVPARLSAEATEKGLVLSWQVPALDGDQVTGYEIEALHVQRGVGIVQELTGITDGESTTWTDPTAVNPELLYVYRVRALFGEETGRWSSFLIIGLDQELPVAPTADLPEPEATRPGHVEPAAVSAPPRQSDPTRAPPVAEVEPTPAQPGPEATAVAPLP